MPANVRILMVDDPRLKPVYQAAESAMHADGHEVIRYREPADLRADSAELFSADVLITGMNCPCPRPVLEAAKKLRAVVVPVIGTELVDVGAATELGIVVGHGATSENSDSMAEATIMLMLNLLYDLRRSEAILRDSLPRPAGQYAHMLRDRTVGLVGLGRIGLAVVKRLQGWDVDILVHSRSGHRDGLPSNVRFTGLEELLQKSDIVSLHAGLNEQTRGLLNADNLRLLKPTAILINTARGGIVDEAAVFEAARDGRIARLGLDTFKIEPLPADSPLRSLPNAILTPHIVGHTVEGGESLGTTIAENLRRVIRGEAPVYVRNPEVLPGWTKRFGNH